MAFNFENLQVWQKALDYSLEVNILIKKFPSEEKYVLSSQFQRAADSIVLNIAEGSTGQTKPEFARFLSIAMRSAIECVSCLHLGKKRNIILEVDFNNQYQKLEEIIKMISGLKKSIKS